MTTVLARSAPPTLFDLEAYDYDLPPEAIAQVPAQRRDAARLLVLERSRDERRHAHVSDLPQILRSGDLLVLNDTRVIPARLRGVTETGGMFEVLLIRPTEAGRWLCLGKPAKRLRPGRRIVFRPGGQSAVVAANDDGRVEIALGSPLDEILEQCGELPLPPYIHREPGARGEDCERYQTVYARVPGAIAAPTAGLHFTSELLERLREAGIETASLTLHVGPGTFQPVRTGDVREHTMEAEWVEISPGAAEAVARAKREGRRVIAVGTTTTRALESRPADDGVEPGAGWAGCFILPGHRFRVIDGLLTNFHLPKSTLLMLVSAFAGRERVLALYREAVERGYRFYSYGDVTLIV